MVSVTSGSLSSLTMIGLLVALIFVYVVNMQRENEKRFKELERKFSRRTEDKTQDPTASPRGKELG